MEVLLNNTLANIEQSNKTLQVTLDLFRLINYASPREWRFTFQFDLSGRYHLFISSNPALLPEEILIVLDGRIPSVYGFGDLFIKRHEKVFKFNSRSSYNKRAIKLDFLECTEDLLDSQIKITGYKLNPTVQQPNLFKKWLYSHTWFGSQKFSFKKLFCEMTVLANKYVVRNINDDSPEQPPIFNKIVNMESFEFFLSCKPLVRSKNTIRHSKYGIFNVDVFDCDFWRKINFEDSITIEINDNLLEWYSYIGPNDFNRVNNILEGLIVAGHEIRNSPEYKKYMSDTLSVKKIFSANALIKRQHKVENSLKVFVDNEFFMAAPSCENELVALYMKLEGANKLPFECKVIEYTEENGIDALAHFRLNNTDHLSKYVPVEFEYVLENYFEHDHPVEQTELIICWDKGDNTLFALGLLQLKLRKEYEWLYLLKSKKQVIPVLVLSKIPSMQVKEAK
jgi:hypothetical protein